MTWEGSGRCRNLHLRAHLLLFRARWDSKKIKWRRAKFQRPSFRLILLRVPSVFPPSFSLFPPPPVIAISCYRETEMKSRSVSRGFCDCESFLTCDLAPNKRILFTRCTIVFILSDNSGFVPTIILNWPLALVRVQNLIQITDHFDKLQFLSSGYCIVCYAF